MPPLTTDPYAQSIQNRIIEEIEQHRPKILVFVEIPTSWFKGDGPWNDLMSWYHRYRDQNYDLIGRIDNFTVKPCFLWMKPPCNLLSDHHINFKSTSENRGIASALRG